MDRIGELDKQSRENLAYKYDEMIKAVDLTQARHLCTITSTLNISAREWRKYCEDIMYLFQYEVLPYMVVGTQNGYIQTDNIEDIKFYLKKRRSLAMSMLKNYYSLKKDLEKRINMSFEVESDDERSIQ